MKVCNFCKGQATWWYGCPVCDPLSNPLLGEVEPWHDVPYNHELQDPYTDHIVTRKA